MLSLSKCYKIPFIFFSSVFIKLFFMFDKSLKSVEEVTEIVKSAYKDGIDKETFDVKLAHIQDKVNHLKEQIQRNNFMYRKEIKEKNKEISRLQHRERALQQKIEHILESRRHGHGHVHHERRHHHFSASSHFFNQVENINKSSQIPSKEQKQIEQLLKQNKVEISNLNEKLSQLAYQNSQLKKLNEDQKIMIEAFINQGLQTSDDQKSCNSMQENVEIDLKVKHKVMDMSERFIQAEEDEDEEEQEDTDDQGGSYMEYQSDNQDFKPIPRKKSDKNEENVVIKDVNKVVETAQIEQEAIKKDENEVKLVVRETNQTMGRNTKKKLPWWLSFLRRFGKND